MNRTAPHFTKDNRKRFLVLNTANGRSFYTKADSRSKLLAQVTKATGMREAKIKTVEPRLKALQWLCIGPFAKYKRQALTAGIYVKDADVQNPRQGQGTSPIYYPKKHSVESYRSQQRKAKKRRA